MNAAKLNFCQGMSEAFRTVWFDILYVLGLPEEDVDLKDWMMAYKDYMRDLKDEWLVKANEALKEDPHYGK